MLCRRSDVGGAKIATTRLIRFARDGKLATRDHMTCSIGRVAAVSVAVATGFPAVPSRAQPQPAASIVTCVNPSSGTTWTINIDYRRATVDDNNALISASDIAWRDREQRNFTLDRTSGKLTVIVASSTGGYMLFDRCKLP
jgi:hypothetical protein